MNLIGEHTDYNNGYVFPCALDFGTWLCIRKNNSRELKLNRLITGEELDTLGYEGRKLPGVTGTRMTGAGFGGCTVSIVEKRYLDQFIDRLGSAYFDITGLKADFYLPETGDGSRRWE